MRYGHLHLLLCCWLLLGLLPRLSQGLQLLRLQEPLLLHSVGKIVEQTGCQHEAGIQRDPATSPDRVGGDSW